MWLLVISYLVIHSSIRSCAGADIPEIKIHLKKHDNSTIECDHIDSPKLTWDKEFTVSVHGDDVVLYRGSCSPGPNNNKIISGFQKKNDYYVSNNMPKVNRHLFNVLACKFYIYPCLTNTYDCDNIKGKYYSHISCDVPVDIRVPNMGYLAVNSKKVQLKEFTPFNKDYDSYGSYSFIDGEQVKITCNKTFGSAVFVQLSSNGNIYNKTELESSTENIEMYIKLIEHYYNGYVDCNFQTHNGDRRLVTRTFLTLKNKSPDYVGFQVNGLTLNPIPNQVNRTVDYIYESFDGEELKVQSFKNNPKYGNITCENTSGHSIESWRVIDGKLEFSTTMKEEQIIVTCIIKLDLSKTKALDGNDRTITLTIVPNSFNYSPAIKGLSMAKMSLKINGTKLNTIHYEYDDEEELNLRCYSVTAGPKWEYNNSDVEAGINNKTKYNKSTNEYELSGKFKLNPGKTSASISCISPESVGVELNTGQRMTRVELYRRKNVIITENTETTVNPPMSSSTIPESSGGKNISMDWTVIFGAFVGIFLIIIAVWTITVLTKKKKLQQTQNTDPTEINYKTLSEHNDRTMNVPAQLNEAQYVSPADTVQNSDYATPYFPQNEDLYSKPLPKNKRQGPSQPNNEDPTYAEIGNLGPTYAEAIPKSKRGNNYVQILPKGVNESLYAKVLQKSNRPGAKLASNESPYAELVLKESPYAEVTQESPYAEVTQESPYAEVKRESPYAKVTYDESPYAEVRTSENPYAEPNTTPTNTYANAFDNQRYVNACSKDEYAEPAYCEINAKK